MGFGCKTAHISDNQQQGERIIGVKPLLKYLQRRVKRAVMSAVLGVWSEVAGARALWLVEVSNKCLATRIVRSLATSFFAWQFHLKNLIQVPVCVDT